ncbi:hypothetical protein UVI_02048120 [Ustilaginoidea virens]|uniref:Tafazzin family protein n=1 Tax=Ustilaginoidea virens TaxID=1159556 RepID=A0A1B5KZI2_USTVR|nr:hypothetical protein UVI_02048120 [Ustilaginoidea virens]
MAGTVAASRQSLSRRLGSMAVMGTVGILSRAFLYALNRVEVVGLHNLLETLDRRRADRSRGLLTVCNHVAVLDDPLIWGILPLRYTLDPELLRWGLGAHDICFRSKASSTFFSLGQVLPTRRLWHSSFGGLYQPTMTQAIGLLSCPSPAGVAAAESCFSTDGKDSFSAPAADPAHRGAWVHVFPEACCHQSPASTLRYFKWGVSRLILESEPAPEFMPMFIHGTQHVMPEERGFPKFLPRIGNRIRIVIGEPTNVDDVFGQERALWRRLVARGEPDLLTRGQDAIQLRIRVARLVRNEVGKLRESIGLPPEEDQTAALAETWSKEPNKRKFKSPVDGSLVNRV